MGQEAKPSEQFLAMVIIQLRQCQKETGRSYIEWLEDFEINNGDEGLDVDHYDNDSLRKAVRKYKDKLYPPKQ